MVTHLPANPSIQIHLSDHSGWSGFHRTAFIILMPAELAKYTKHHDLKNHDRIIETSCDS